MPTTAQRIDVLGAYRFEVEVDGLVIAGFTEVSGLQGETEYEEYHEGGVNSFTYRFPKKTSFPPLVLKRGMTDNIDLWYWYDNVVNGYVRRKNGSVILIDQSGHSVCRWNFFDAYPVKWIGPDLNASQSAVAVETLELVHNGLKLIKDSSLRK